MVRSEAESGVMCQVDSLAGDTEPQGFEAAAEGCVFGYGVVIACGLVDLVKRGIGLRFRLSLLLLVERFRACFN